MPDVQWETASLIRRRGGLERVTAKGVDKYPEDDVRQGSRRSRQIAKRHWYRKYSYSFCSCCGNGGNQTTTKTPGKKEGYVGRGDVTCLPA